MPFEMPGANVSVSASAMMNATGIENASSAVASRWLLSGNSVTCLAARNAAKATIATAKAGRKAARGLLVLTVSNYDLGIGDADELFDAFGSYTETSSDYFRAVHDYNVAVAELSRAVGEELLDLDY